VSEKSEPVTLPEDSTQIASWSELSPAYATMERGPDGSLYFVSWWHGKSTVLFVSRPDGTTWQKEDC
jgi:hypothetical protein